MNDLGGILRLNFNSTEETGSLQRHVSCKHANG